MVGYDATENVNVANDAEHPIPVSVTDDPENPVSVNVINDDDHPVPVEVTNDIDHPIPVSVTSTIHIGTVDQGAPGAEAWPVTDDVSHLQLEDINDNAIVLVQNTGEIAAGTADLVTNSSLIADNTLQTSLNTDDLHTDLGHLTDGTQQTQVTNFPATQPVSAAALPLPAGAATSLNQTNGTQATKITNGFVFADIVIADQNGIPASIQTKATTVTFTSPTTQLPAGVGINTDGYSTIEYDVMAGSANLIGQWSNDGSVWNNVQWYRWADMTGPFNTMATGSAAAGSRLVCQVLGHYFRLSIAALTINPTDVLVTLSTKPFVPPVLTTVISSGVITGISNAVTVTSRGTIGTPNPVVAMSATPATVKAANANRKELIIQNSSGQILYLLLAASGVVAPALHSVMLGVNERYVTQTYTGLVTGVLALGSGNIMVTEVT